MPSVVIAGRARKISRNRSGRIFYVTSKGKRRTVTKKMMKSIKGRKSSQKSIKAHRAASKRRKSTFRSVRGIAIHRVRKVSPKKSAKKAKKSSK